MVVSGNKGGNNMKMSDKNIDKLFEGMSRETAKKVANQGSPKTRKPTTKNKKTTKGKK